MMENNQRGRPPAKREAVRACIAEHHARGHLVSLSRIARECGLYDYRDARRIVDDLKSLGAVAA
jgi:hypothetical protein